ncbi:hypothetical protein EDB87DRAFT_1819454, partial [Lactarius vividus]
MTVVILRKTSYALPAVLHDYVQAVALTTYFGSLSCNRLADAAQALQSTVMDKAPSGEPVTVLSRRNDVGEADPSFLRLESQYPSPVDLTAFMNEFRVEAAAAAFAVESNNIQYARAMACPTPLIFYGAGNKLSPNNETAP